MDIEDVKSGGAPISQDVFGEAVTVAIDQRALIWQRGTGVCADLCGRLGRSMKGSR